METLIFGDRRFRGWNRELGLGLRVPEEGETGYALTRIGLAGKEGKRESGAKEEEGGYDGDAEGGWDDRDRWMATGVRWELWGPLRRRRDRVPETVVVAAAAGVGVIEGAGCGGGVVG